MADPVVDEVKDSANPETPIVETPTYTEQEQSAMLLGWKPQDQFEGDAAGFRSAREFLERGEMIGKIRSLSKQNGEITRAIQHMSTQNNKLYENGYKAAMAELKAEKRAALADNDLVKAEDVQEKIDDLKANQNSRQQAPAITPNDPDHDAWVAANPWYSENEVLHNFADGLALAFVNKNKNSGITAEDVRNYVTKTVKEEFAHRMSTKPVVGAPSPDGAGRQSGKPGSSSNQLSALKASMSETDRDIMKTIVKSTGMTEAEYLKQYQA